MSKHLDGLVNRWWRDNRSLLGVDREARQQALWDALAAVGGEHEAPGLLALCDDVAPFVVVLSRDGAGTRNDPTHINGHTNANRVAYLRTLNASRFGPKAGRAAS
jgi:hypothetical protein